MDSAANKPVLYKDKWILWKNIKPYIFDLTSCNDSIYGYCIKVNDLDECIEKSVDGIGWYTEFKNEKLCNPVQYSTRLSDININRVINNLEIVHRDNKHIKDTTTTLFTNTEKFKYPPDDVNKIFYTDIGTLVSKNSNYELKNISLLPTHMKEFATTRYFPIYYSNNVAIFNRDTLYIAYINRYGILDWVKSSGQVSDSMNYFKIISPKSYDNKDHIYYDDYFLILYKDSYLYCDDGNIYGNYIDYDIVKNDDKYLFKLNSTNDTFTCKDGECTKILYDSNQEKDKDEVMYRTKNCFFACDKIEHDNLSQLQNADSANTTKFPILMWVSIGIALIFIIFIIKYY